MYALRHRGVDYLTNKPKGIDDAAPVVVGIHGDSRDHLGLYNTLIKAAGTRSVTIVCPLFRTTSDPILSSTDPVWTDDSWKIGAYSVNAPYMGTFEWLEDVSYRLAGKKPVFVGHSAGGQFLQRFAYISALAPKIVVANPGSYMWHTTQWSYKYGLANLPLQMTQPVTNRPFTLLLGTADTDPNDPTLDKSKAAMWQGANRYARGRFYSTIHNVPYTDVPNVGHTASGMFRSTEGIKAVFG
jgi:pimeloyl-ACP methyl ester carboxylesterase